MGSKASGRRVLVVHNPSAGVRQPPADRWLEALACLGGEVRLCSLAEASVDEALREPADLVVAAGGDGTFGKVARRLVGSERLLTLVPLGTANNLATHLGFSLDPVRAVEQLGAARERRLDVGVASGPFGARFFFEGAGLGFLAEAMPALTAYAHATNFASAEAKVRAVRTELAARVDRQPARMVRLELDGKKVERECVMVEALNAGAVGPRLSLAPGADTGDGMLDVVLVDERARGWLRARASASAPEGAGPTSTRAREVRYEWSGAPLHVDDHLVLSEPGISPFGVVTLEVRPGALHVLSPLGGRPRAR